MLVRCTPLISSLRRYGHMAVPRAPDPGVAPHSGGICVEHKPLDGVAPGGAAGGGVVMGQKRGNIPCTQRLISQNSQLTNQEQAGPA
jgi:hypothetical protein